MSAKVSAGELSGAHAGVEEDPDDGGVAAVLEGVARAGLEQPGELVEVEDRHGLFGHRGRAHCLHRGPLELAVDDEPAEELLQRAVVLGDGGRCDALVHRGQVALERAAGDRGVAGVQALRVEPVAQGGAARSGRTRWCRGSGSWRAGGCASRRGSRAAARPEAVLDGCSHEARYSSVQPLCGT